MNKYVLIVAGGKGLRMGGDLPKQFIPMRGKPLLMHTLEAFHRWDASARIILVLPEDHQPYWNMLCKEIGCKVPHAIKSFAHRISPPCGQCMQRRGGKDHRSFSQT